MESLATLGLPEWVTKVGAIVEMMRRVGVCDRDSHGAWYEVVAGKAEEGDGLSAVAE